MCRSKLTVCQIHSKCAIQNMSVHAVRRSLRKNGKQALKKTICIKKVLIGAKGKPLGPLMTGIELSFWMNVELNYILRLAIMYEEELAQISITKSKEIKLDTSSRVTIFRFLSLSQQKIAFLKFQNIRFFTSILAFWF